MISDIENSLLVKYLKNELNEEESQKAIQMAEKLMATIKDKSTKSFFLA